MSTSDKEEGEIVETKQAPPPESKLPFGGKWEDCVPVIISEEDSTCAVCSEEVCLAAAKRLFLCCFMQLEDTQELIIHLTLKHQVC